jgi:hypothetical protein
MTRVGASVVALGAVAAVAVPLTLASAGNVTSAAAKPNGGVAELTSVGGSGLRGLAVARKREGKLRFHVTLACSQACPTGATANGVRMRFKFARGGCGEPQGKTASLRGGTLGPGGLNVIRGVAITPDNDLNEASSVRGSWDPDHDGDFEPAVCGRMVKQEYID